MSLTSTSITPVANSDILRAITAMALGIQDPVLQATRNASNAVTAASGAASGTGTKAATKSFSWLDPSTWFGPNTYLWLVFLAFALFGVWRLIA